MKAVIRRYFAFQFFFSLLLWLPVFYEFQRRIGLTDEQIFGIQSIYYIVFALLDIPTGLLADRIGTRHSLRAGAVTLFFANLVPVFAASYMGMLSHFLLIALARSLISGASSAYIYDFLRHNNAVPQYKEVEGAARSYSLIGKVVCWSIVGALMEWKLSLPYILTAMASAISAGFAFSLPSILQNKLNAAGGDHSAKPSTWRTNLHALANALAGNPLLWIIMLQGVALFVLVRILQVNLFQPLLGSKHFDVTSYGIIMSLMTFFEAIGSYKPGWISRWMSDLNAIFILSLMMAGTIALMPWAGASSVIICLCAFSWIAGASFPIQKQLINDAISDSSFRATIISLESIIDRSICAVVAALIGGFLSDGRLNDFLLLSALWTAVAMLLLGILVRVIRQRRIHEV
jgi:predicted MFS family arabinose efflux permease